MAGELRSSKGKRIIRTIVIPVAVVGVVLVGLFVLWNFLKKKQTQQPARQGKSRRKMSTY